MLGDPQLWGIVPFLVAFYNSMQRFEAESSIKKSTHFQSKPTANRPINHNISHITLYILYSIAEDIAPLCLIAAFSC